MSTEAIWSNGRQSVPGRWEYKWAGGFFVVELDRRDSVTGLTRTFRVYDDVPEWGKWKRVPLSTPSNEGGDRG